MARILLKPVFKEAWNKVAGTKQTFFIPFVALGLIQLLLIGLEAYLRPLFPNARWMILLDFVLFGICCIPIITGLLMIGVRRARGQEIHLKQGFMYFKKTVPLFLTGLMVLLTSWAAGLIVSFLIIHFSSLFLTKSIITLMSINTGLTQILSFILASLLPFSLIYVADQNQNPWQAYKNSVKTVVVHFRLVILALLACLLFTLVAVIPFGIGFIWTLPFSQIVIGILYREISQPSQTT